LSKIEAVTRREGGRTGSRKNSNFTGGMIQDKVYKYCAKKKERTLKINEKHYSDFSQKGQRGRKITGGTGDNQRN